MKGNLRFLREGGREGQGSTPPRPPASQACSLISTLMLRIQTQICFGHQPPSTYGLIPSNLWLSDLGGGEIQLSARHAHASGPQATCRSLQPRLSAGGTFHQHRERSKSRLVTSNQAPPFLPRSSPAGPSMFRQIQREFWEEFHGSSSEKLVVRRCWRSGGVASLQSLCCCSRRRRCAWLELSKGTFSVKITGCFRSL